MKKSFTPIARGRSTALEIASLKRYFHLLPFMFFVCCTLLIASCEEKDKVSPDDDPDIEDPDVDSDIDNDTDTISVNFESAVGLVIDTRPIFKKGYKPTEVKVSLDGDFSIFSQVLLVDEFTNLAILRISLDDLTEDQIKRFSLGVPLTIQVLNDQQEILTETSDDNMSINDSNIPWVMETALPKVFEPVILNPNIPYLVQVTNSRSDENIWDVRGKDVRASFYIEDNLSSFHFEQVIEGNDSIFYIKESSSSRYLRLEPSCAFFNGGTAPVLVVSEESLPRDEPDFKFILKRDEEGISIRSINGVQLKLSNRCYTGTKIFVDDEYLDADIVKLRIAPANIQWTVEDLGTEFNIPILPPVNIDFAYNTRVENCANVIVMESVGKQETRTTSYTVSSEESFQLSGSFMLTESETTNASANLNIAGVDVGGYSYETGTSLSYGVDSTSTSTKGFSETGQQEVQVSRVRTIELPPYTAVEVYDIIMSLKQVRISFAQKIRIRGQYEGGTRLSGGEIVSQLTARPFDGVITEIGNNYVVFTVKGEIRVDEAIEATTRVTELDIEDTCK